MNGTRACDGKMGLGRYDVGNAMLRPEQVRFGLDDVYVLRGYRRGEVFFISLFSIFLALSLPTSISSRVRFTRYCVFSNSPRSRLHR